MQLKKGLHGGTVSTIELKLNITKDMNGAVYTCQAMNEALQRSVHDASALKVMCKLIIIRKLSISFVYTEERRKIDRMGH